MNSREHVCSICSASADGMHYGAISCRSCNAFFRRSVVENANYSCKFFKKCVIDTEGRCTCRYCRFNKCLKAGMNPAAVQPRRDPTGTQKKKRTVCSSEAGHSWSNPSKKIAGDDHMECDELSSVRTILEKSVYTHSAPEGYALMKRLFMRNLYYQALPHIENHFEFLCSVQFYNQHLRMMQLFFSTISSFLEMLQSRVTLREMSPLDNENLRNVELNGLFFWLDSINAYKQLSSVDQGNLLKRYSIRKVSLDRFYIASLHISELQKNNFVLNNNTYVPPNRTDFEVIGENEKQLKFKKETFAETSARSWKNVVLRFKDLSIKDAEMVYLQFMLLWSVSNHNHVSALTKRVMKDQRNLAIKNIFEYYSLSNTIEPEVRFAEITMILGELEEIFDMHCLDIQIFKVFGLSELGNTWYVDVCHSELNNPRLEWDSNMIENLKDLNFRNVQECVKKWKMEIE